MTPLEINKKIASMRAHDGIDNDHPFSAKKNRRYCWAQLIDDAWELFEEMPNAQITRAGNVGDFFCSPDYLDPHFIDFDKSAKTGPMAICLTWIKWKENSESVKQQSKP